jgi:hypothetical protein
MILRVKRTWFDRLLFVAKDELAMIEDVSRGERMYFSRFPWGCGDALPMPPEPDHASKTRKEDGVP